MQRKLRVEYPGAMYHVMSRGDRCEAIYLDDVDRQDCIKTLAEACHKEGKLGEHRSGELRRETAEAKPERIVAEDLRRLGLKEIDLVSRPKSDPAKLAIAARLRIETTLPIKAIAIRVRLGTSKSANARLHGWMGPGVAGASAQGRLPI